MAGEGSSRAATAMLAAAGPAPPRSRNRVEMVSTVTVTEMNDFYKPFSTLYLHKDDKARILQGLTLYKSHSMDMSSWGLPSKLGMLLAGEPGTGKTSTIYASATLLGLPVWYINLGGLTCGDLKAMFHLVYKERGGGVVVFEDIDHMSPIVCVGGGKSCAAVGFEGGGSAGSAGSADATETTAVDLASSDDVPLNLSYFLNFLDGVLAQKQAVIIATTNNPERLDPAFKRPGRFDLHITLRKACRAQIDAIFQSMLGRGVDPAVLDAVPEYEHSTASVIFRCKQFVLPADRDTPDAVILGPFLRDKAE
jgi:hypothetical protein